MAISFKTAVAVESGQRVTSTQHATLAQAFNDRLRAFSFCGWRIAWFWFNLWRQVRNPDTSGFVFPSQGEFNFIYQHLDPEHHLGTTWPEAGPGEPEGANLANPMNQFVFGIADPQDPTGGLDAEDVRLNFGLPFLLTATPTGEQLWELGKAQRGAYDPITTAQNAPALEVAESHFQVVQPVWSTHGKALGGWLPMPVQLLSDCGATESTGLGIASFEIKFTGLRTDVSTDGLHGTITADPDGNPVVTYAGTCPCGSDSYATGHVLGIGYGPLAYHVYVGDGSVECGYDVDVLPVADWIEGPYTGEGQLSHTVGSQLQRALWAFQSDFRGTPAQRSPDTFKIRRIAFDNQRFFERQYALAPNVGILAGDSILAVYPRADFNVSAGGNVPRGTFGTMVQTNTTEHHYAADFVLGGVFAAATGLMAKTQLAFYSGEQLLATLDLAPDESGNASAIFWVKTASRPDPLKVKLSLDATFAPGGTLYAEATEQVAYKPNFWDAYLVSRFGASQGGDQFGGGVDGRGRDYSDAKGISDAYFSTGTLNNYLGVRSIAEWVNDNPVFDVARRLSRDHARVTRRQQLVSYEVADGKSILRFKRFAQYPGIDGVEVRADCFADIAPPLDAVAFLVESETYIVRGSGSITYQGADFTQGQTFTATFVSEFESTGDAAVYVHDGIRHAALKRAFTNEWTMFVEPRCYHPSETSIWKPAAYGDYFAWCDRCHFYSGTAPAALRRFAAINNSTSLDPVTFQPTLNPPSVQASMLAPEVPDSFRYAAGANVAGGSSEFYKSCQVLNRPYEIESCVVDDWASEQVIKVTLTARLRSHPNAPATVAADPMAWSFADVEALANAGASPEDYRTDDNAVREYVRSLVDGNYSCVFRTGDAGTGSVVSFLPDNPFGSCYPVFFFSRLIPVPYDDGNDLLESQDSRCVIDSMLHMEVALRSMCEGFVDGQTSQDIICETGLGNLYDFKFENLCFEGFGGRWIGAFDLTTRPDEPSGFGPLPNSKMYAEVFNRLVSTVNLLDKVRLDLPIKFMYRTYDYTATARPVTLTELNGSVCSLVSQAAAYGDGLGPETPVTPSTISAWTDWGGPTLGASRSCNLDGCPYVLAGARQDNEYRVEIDPAFLDAVPDEIQDLIDNGNTGFLATRADFRQAERRETVPVGDADRCPAVTGLALWNDAGTEYYRWVTNTSETISECMLISSGFLTAPSVPPSDYKIAHAIGEPGFCGNNATTSSGLTLVGEQGAFIQVPLI